MDKIEQLFQKKERNSEAMYAFGYRLKNQFAVNEAFRRPKELQWLEDLRAYKGIYDPDVRIDANASKVYPKITRSKINIVLSRLHEMLFPETEKNWEIKPTPEPKIAEESVRQIVEGLLQQGGDVGMEQVRLGIQEFCDDRCKTMSRVIDDQLTEMDYAEEVKKVLRSGLTYGTGIMKGPMINKRNKHIWEPDSAGEFIENQQTEEVPYFDFVRIWDWYPDMTVTETQMIEGSYQRHLMTKHDLRALLDRADYHSDLIKKYLEEHPDGDYVPKNWELDLQMIEVQAGAKQTTSSFSTAPNTRTSNRQIGKKYQVLEYWGFVDGRDLEACGVEVPDVELEYSCNVWLLGNVPIKAVLFDGALDKYKVFYYEKDETSLFGEGLARVMRHSQLAIAAAARMVLDNGACVAGPQVEANWSLLTPDTDMDSFYPRKIWWREGRGVEAQYPAIRPLNFDSHIEDLLKIVESFKQFGDEETTLPTWMIGQMVQNETARATSGRMATITISIKDVVKNFDAFTEKIIRDLYSWNMEFNPRPDIKGDYNIKARGVSSLVMKEIRMEALNNLMSTMTPEDWVYVDRRELLEERFRAHDINIELKTEEAANEIRQEQQNSIMNQLQIEMMKSEIAKNKAQAMTNLTKAKEKNIMANKAAQTPPETENSVDPRMQDMELAKKQSEIDDQRLKSQLKADEAQSKNTQMTQQMMHDEESHRVQTAMDIEKHKNELDLKKQQAQHGMKMKEVAAKAAKAKKPAKKGTK